MQYSIIIVVVVVIEYLFIQQHNAKRTSRIPI